MTNEQWSDVTRYLKLPETARKPLEEQLEGYQSRELLFEVAGAEPDLRPSDVKKKLERAASLAGELLDILTRAHAARRPDCPAVFHVNGTPAGIAVGEGLVWVSVD